MHVRHLSRVTLSSDADSHNALYWQVRISVFPTVLGAGGTIHPLPHYDVGTNAIKGKRARVKTRVL